MLLYSAFLTLAAALSAPVWGWRMARQGRYRTGLRQRLGSVHYRLRAAVQGRPVVWLHAVSVGEVMASTRLVHALEAALPGHVVVVSTTTPTGQHVAQQRFGVDRVFFFPLDFASAVRAYLRVLKPRMLVLMESELWPRMLMECSRAGVPVAVVNARVSDRSLPRYRALRTLWRPLLRRVSLLLAQSEQDAQRWVSIGAPKGRVQVTGNLKFDVQEAAESSLIDQLGRHVPLGVRVIVCGSTHEGEEAVLLDCIRGFLPNQQVTILAPRHPERIPHIESLAKERGIGTVRLSQWRQSPAELLTDTVLLVDSVGELSALYSLAHVAFVGGSLVPRGGQNPLEPTRYGVPVVMGEHFENFRSVVAAMQEAGAITIVTAASVGDALAAALMTERTELQSERSRALFDDESGATQRTVVALLLLLKEAS